jgi:hypothetical protein
VNTSKKSATSLIQRSITIEAIVVYPARAEQTALKFVGVSLLLLAAYVTFDAFKSLATKEQPQRSVIGIALSVLSLIVMRLLTKAKRRTAAELSSAALHADSRQTSICGGTCPQFCSADVAERYAVVVGRTRRSPGYGSHHCAGRPRGN